MYIYAHNISQTRAGITDVGTKAIQYCKVGQWIFVRKFHTEAIFFPFFYRKIYHQWIFAPNIRSFFIFKNFDIQMYTRRFFSKFILYLISYKYCSSMEISYENQIYNMQLRQSLSVYILPLFEHASIRGFFSHKNPDSELKKLIIRAIMRRLFLKIFFRFRRCGVSIDQHYNFAWPSILRAHA